MSKTSVLIADDHKLFREGLTMLLSSKGDFELVGEASSGPEAVALAESALPDIILLDLAMPGGNGIDAIPRILASAPGAKVLAVSSHTDEALIREALDSGASGFIYKGDAFAEVDAAIRYALSGHRYLSPKIADIVYSSYLEGAGSRSREDPVSTLTPRERTVLRLLCEGKYPKAIASELSISRKTVDIHKRNILQKLGVDTDIALLRIGLRSGILPADETIS